MRGVREGTNMTMTAPLALTQAKMTWVGVMPKQEAAVLSGVSTRLLGYNVIGLSEGRVCEKDGRGDGGETERQWERKGSIYVRLPYASVTIPCWA